MRMQLFSMKHPVKESLINGLRTRTAVIPHRSNLENTLQQFSHMTEAMETIEPFIQTPWWTLKAKTRIEKAKDITKDTHDKIQELPDATVATIYTDGSGIEKKIGAGAYAATSREVSHHHLGGESQFNIYTAEITGMQLALEGLWEYQTHPSCCIYTDSQTTIKAIERPQRQSGQAIIKDLLDFIDKIMSAHEHLQIEILWIPGTQRL